MQKKIKKKKSHCFKSAVETGIFCLNAQFEAMLGSRQAWRNDASTAPFDGLLAYVRQA